MNLLPPTLFPQPIEGEADESKTKLIVTLGPAVGTEEMIGGLLERHVRVSSTLRFSLSKCFALGQTASLAEFAYKINLFPFFQVFRLDLTSGDEVNRDKLCAALVWYILVRVDSDVCCRTLWLC